MKTAALVCLGLLALSVVPVSGHAAAPRLPGEKCGPAYDNVQIGTTTMDQNSQNIIACLKTGEKTQDGKEDSEWKAMTSSGGGITGGCVLRYSQHLHPSNQNILLTDFTADSYWGKGCVKPYGSYNSYNTGGCGNAAQGGYTCGMSSQWYDDNNNSGGPNIQRYNVVCMCTKL